MSKEKKNEWPGPAGLIPVTSGKADDANVINRAYLDHLQVEMRVVDAQLPDLETEIFGRTYALPIMMPAFSHLNKVGKDGRKPMTEYALAARELNVLNWVGMEPDDVYGEIAKTGADTVRIIKPFADHEMIMQQIEYARNHGAVAVGIDIDHIAGKDGGYDVVDGLPLGPVLQEDLKAYAEAARLPFIAKGVLSVNDALKCKEAGCKAIVVSHHHGRIPFGMPPVAVLPGIVKALKGSGMLIFVDCGIDSGYDAYKALALGADAVAVGRGILKPLLKEGKDGVVAKVNDMKQQLAELMLYTGICDTRSFDPTVIHTAF
ncbi:MAG: alpha-hydroxy-acid oxidizing protein [Prevotella sp.]|nr:alpha-hydroxy-acid oxidizing protein [Prevotella sp.]MDY5259485.1 alpha-hydroxy-acid oxidizing protein [Prevotella sp.]